MACGFRVYLHTVQSSVTNSCTLVFNSVVGIRQVNVRMLSWIGPAELTWVRVLCHLEHREERLNIAVY